MTGFKSKKAAARDKLEALAQPAQEPTLQEPTLQEQLDKAKADWDKAHAVWDKAHADIKRINQLMEQQNG